MTTLISPISSARSSDLVFVSQTNELVTDSLLVATFFGKRHEQVLRKLKTLDCSPSFSQHNFVLTHYHDSQEKVRPKYQMTKDGFMFLVMGFTGKRAAEIKERYIEAFNEMAERLANEPNSDNLLELPDFRHQRVLLTVDNGQVTSSRILSSDEMLMNRYQYINYFKEPDVGFSDVEQLAELSRLVNERLCKQISKR